MNKNKTKIEILVNLNTNLQYKPKLQTKQLRAFTKQELQPKYLQP